MPFSIFLFKVEAHFTITLRGLTLCPGLGEIRVKMGSRIKIIRPDKTIVKAIIRGISFHEPHCISVGTELTKDDVPVGSEVWTDV